MTGCLTEGEDLVFLHEPSPDLIFQYRFTTNRSQAFAVDDPQATAVLAVAVFDEAREGHSSLIASQAVQIKLGLYGPVPLSQAPEGV